MADKPPRQPQVLLWPDEPQKTAPEDQVALREMQRKFWSQIPPPFYETRVIDYQLQEELSWD